MPKARNRNVAERLSVDDDLNALHFRVITDHRLDLRYVQPISNRDKVSLLCAFLGEDPDDFDLNSPFPLVEWINKLDLGMLRAGVYVSDMRVQFYLLVMQGMAEKDVRPELWENHALAVYWTKKFDDAIYRHQKGEVRPDDFAPTVH